MAAPAKQSSRGSVLQQSDKPSRDMVCGSALTLWVGGSAFELEAAAFLGVLVLPAAALPASDATDVLGFKPWYAGVTGAKERFPLNSPPLSCGCENKTTSDMIVQTVRASQMDHYLKVSHPSPESLPRLLGASQASLLSMLKRVYPQRLHIKLCSHQIY